MKFKETLRVLCLPMLCAVAISSLVSHAGIDIDNPTAGTKYAPSATIASKGNTFLGVDVIVKILKNDVVQDEKHVIPGKQSIDWQHDFDPPSGGWPLGTDYKCSVWDADDVTDPPDDTKSFEVVTP
jgi:hypothetical protein